MTSRVSARARNVFVLLGASFLARLLLSLSTELYPDEAYYLAWSRRPALGYFDHPPGVAWVLWLLPPRVMALLCGAATCAAVYLLARTANLSRERAAFSAVLFAWLPLDLLLGTFALPDAPLMLFWTLALAAFLRERWALGALCIGLSCLSKYTGILLVPIALAALAERRAWRALAPAVLIVLVCVAPILVWNAQHDWVSLRFQLHHGFAGKSGVLGAGRYLLGQVGVTLGLAPWACWTLARGSWRAPRVLPLAVAVPLGVFLVSSFRAPVEVNWPALASPALVVVLAAQERTGLRRWVWGAVASGVVIVVALAVPGPWTQRMRRPLSRLHGWSALGALNRLGAEAAFTDTYQLAGEIEAYAHLPATVEETDRPSQYGLWEKPWVRPGADALWVSEGAPPPSTLAREFEKLEALPVLEPKWGSLVTHRFRVFRLHRRQPTP